MQERRLRIRLDQFNWSKGRVELYATKTENGRESPIWNCIRDLVQRRIAVGLTDGESLFLDRKP